MTTTQSFFKQNQTHIFNSQLGWGGGTVRTQQWQGPQDLNQMGHSVLPRSSHHGAQGSHNSLYPVT